MTHRAGRPLLAPSSKIALYLAAVIGVYLIGEPRAAAVAAAALCAVAFICVAVSGGRIPGSRLRGAAFFIAWVFVMRIALDLVSGGSVTSGDTLLLATRQALRVALLIIGALALVALTPARALVDELETTRLPRSARLLVMMLVQYPRVLRDRYDQIVEAQVARGADRPRSILQRVAYGSRVLLPVMQSELNAIGERAGLIHLRGLDVDVAIPDDARTRATIDRIAVVVAAVAIVAAIVLRVAR